VTSVYLALEGAIFFKRQYGVSSMKSAVSGILIIAVGSLTVVVVGGNEVLTLITEWSSLNVAQNSSGLATMLRRSSLPVRILLGPLSLFLMPYPPWEVLLANRSAAGYFFAASSIVLYLIAPFFLLGARSTLSKASLERSVILAFILVTSLGISAVYAGTVPRFRTSIEPFVLILVAVGLLRGRRVETVYVVYVVALAGFTAGYYLLFA
jgi:hypothetical protein